MFKENKDIFSNVNIIQRFINYTHLYRPTQYNSESRREHFKYINV